MRWILTLLLVPIAANAGESENFIDTRVSFTMGDDDFLHGPGETTPSSPRLSFGDRGGYELFFDNLNTSSTGRENELHLVLYKKMPGFIPRLSTEAAAAIEIDMTEIEDDSPKAEKIFEDDGSYVRITYDLMPGEAELVVFPFSTNRFRLGYLYDLTWGGDRIFPGRKGPAPGAKIGVKFNKWYSFAGIKAAQIHTQEPFGRQESGESISGGELQTFYGALAGGGVRFGRIWADLGLGHFQMGENPVTEVRGEPVTSTGGSARIAWVHGSPIGVSADLKLFRTDPDFLEGLNRPASYPGGLSYSVALEGNYLIQTLNDPDNFQQTKRQAAPAAALSAKAKYWFWRSNLTVFFRSLEFIVHETPSFDPYVSFPEEAQVNPEIFIAGVVDRYFPSLRLTPGFQAGIEFPATIKNELSLRQVGASASDTVLGTQTVIVRADGTQSILPEGSDAVPIYSLKASARWDLSAMLSAVFMVFVKVDDNQSRLEATANLTKQRTLEEPVRVGGAAILQARF